MLRERDRIQKATGCDQADLFMSEGMVLPVEECQTVYADGFGAEFEAIQLPWNIVTDLLGREHRGASDDDVFLVGYLLRCGAPEWVKTARGWIDEAGWGPIGAESAGNGFASP